MMIARRKAFQIRVIAVLALRNLRRQVRRTLLTATAIITARLTILPPSRTFAGYWQTSGPRRENDRNHDVLRALGINDNDD